MYGLILQALVQVGSPDGRAAQVTGIVLDAVSGRALAGATVSAPDAGRFDVTDLHGRYAFSSLPSGSLRLTVRYVGRHATEQRAIVPQSGTLEINVVLDPLPERLAAVEVRRFRDASSRFGADGRRMRVIAADDQRSNPLLAEPDLLRAVAGGEAVMAPEVPGGIHLRGGSSDQTAYTLDGVPVFNPYHVSDLMGAWNTDALQSARIDYEPTEVTALSGVMALATRPSGMRVAARGSASTTHARFTADGPLAFGNGAFLIGARTAFPAALAPDDDPTFVRGLSRDGIARIELATPFSGRLMALLTASQDRLGVSPVRPDLAQGTTADANSARWSSWAGSMQWRRAWRGDSLVTMIWRSGTSVQGNWGTSALTSFRQDDGVQMSLAHSARLAWRAGLRAERPRIRYEVSDSNASRWSNGSAAALWTAFGDASRQIGTAVGLRANVAVVAFRGRPYATSALRARWSISDRAGITGAYTRSHQFAQSVRNAESVVGNILPAELFVAAGVGGMPVASNEEVAFSADVVLRSGITANVSTYSRRMRGLVLVATVETAPFLRGPLTSGRARVSGASAELTMRRKHLLALARLGLQNVRYLSDTLSYVPGFGARFVFDGGVTVTPTSTTRLRLGLTAASGRRVTPAAGALEWESCNLKDRGCEFAGNPTSVPTLTGALRAPGYARVDIGIRQEVHIGIHDRAAEFAAFLTFSNVLNRFNVLTYTVSETGLTPIGMRPASPLVVGLDWRF